MLDVLLESKAPHTRRIGGTLASTLVHGAIITGAVLLTVQPPHFSIKEPPLGPGPIYIPVDHKPAPQVHRPPANDATPIAPHAPGMELPPIDHVPTTIAPVDPNVAPIAPGNLIIGPASAPPGVIGGPAGPVSGPGEAMEVRLVDKPPRVLRSEQPRFPEALRSRGQNGRIVVQFVVDTLGRAEMSEFKVVDATDAQLADPVRAVLPRFRFTPGEAGGHRVRTLVALPFDFTLVR
jgi:periplasmic protein TonB